MNENDLRAFIYSMKQAIPDITVTVAECMDELDYLLEMSEAEALHELHINMGISADEVTEWIKNGKQFV